LFLLFCQKIITIYIKCILIKFGSVVTVLLRQGKESNQITKLYYINV